LGCGRAKRPFAARTRLFLALKTKNGALRAPAHLFIFANVPYFSTTQYHAITFQLITSLLFLTISYERIRKPFNLKPNGSVNFLRFIGAKYRNISNISLICSMGCVNNTSHASPAAAFVLRTVFQLIF
jgi:hypothetical protein